MVVDPVAPTKERTTPRRRKLESANRYRTKRDRAAQLTNLEIINEQRDRQSSDEDPDGERDVPHLGHVFDELLSDHDGRVVIRVVVEGLDARRRGGSDLVSGAVGVGLDGGDDLVEGESTGVGLEGVAATTSEKSVSNARCNERCGGA